MTVRNPRHAILDHDQFAAAGAFRGEQRRAAAHAGGSCRNAHVRAGLVADAATYEAHHALDEGHALGAGARIPIIDESIDRH
jgi:hypothetical protein